MQLPIHLLLPCLIFPFIWNCWAVNTTIAKATINWTCLIRITLSLQHILNIKNINYKVSTQWWWPSEKRKRLPSNSGRMEYVNNKEMSHHVWTSENISHLYENHIMLSSRTNTIKYFSFLWSQHILLSRFRYTTKVVQELFRYRHQLNEIKRTWAFALICIKTICKGVV